MADDQFGFSFDAPLTEMPVSQIPPRPVLPPVPANLASLKGHDLIVYLFGISEAIEGNEIAYTTVLDLAGFPLHTQTAELRARMLEAILPPNGNWQCYRVEPGNKASDLRFRRLPPLGPCRGELCADLTRPTLTRGVFCERCADAEAEDLYNND